MLESLKLHRSGKALIGNCPCCGYKNALSITEKDGKRLYFCHAGCKSSKVWAAVRGGEEYESRDTLPRSGPKPANMQLQDYVRKLWQSSLPAKGTLAEIYLRTRGIIDIPAALRFLPRHSHKPTGTVWPVILTGVTDNEQRLRAVHRTYVAHDGRDKAPVEPAKMTLGSVAGYSAHLAPAGEKMAVAEGIETALTVQQATGIPTWAALSAGGIVNLILPPLPLAGEVIVAADNDESSVGQHAAEAAAARWLAEGRRVKIALPPKVGSDFNDILREGVA